MRTGGLFTPPGSNEGNGGNSSATSSLTPIPSAESVLGEEASNVLTKIMQECKKMLQGKKLKF